MTEINNYSVEELLEALRKKGQSQPETHENISHRDLEKRLDGLNHNILEDINSARSIFTIKPSSKSKLIDLAMSYLISLEK